MKISKELNQSYQKFDKNGLRKRVLNNNFRSNQIGSDECIANCINFLESINFQSIALYSATKYEISVNKIFFHLLNKSKRIFFPKINGDKLNFYLVKDLSELIIGKYNILEPSSSTVVDVKYLDFIIVPCLAIDKNNKRIGYGKGYYDKALEEVNKNKLISLIGKNSYFPNYAVTNKYDIEIGNIFLNKNISEDNYEYN